MKYIVHTAIKCSDDKVHRLSYDLVDQTEGSVKELGRVFTEIETRFPDVQFFIQQYPEDTSNVEFLDFNAPGMIDIHGSIDAIFPNLAVKNTTVE